MRGAARYRPCESSGNKRLELEAKALKPSVAMHDLKNAISLGEQALGEGVNILDNFARADAERSRREATKATK